MCWNLEGQQIELEHSACMGEARIVNSFFFQFAVYAKLWQLAEIIT